jgi:hypothetical protein
MREFRIVSIAVLMTGLALADVGGRITGVVKDETGAVIAGAVVAAVNIATSVRQTTATGEQGVYSFPTLAVGQYNVEVAAPSFRHYRRTGLVIDVNSALQVDVTLQLAGQSEAITVSEEAEQVHVEKADTQMGQTISGQRISEAPLNGRSYTDLLAIQTGVTPVTTSATSSTSSGG